VDRSSRRVTADQPAISKEATVLILSRKVGEAILVPSLGITIEVVAIRPHSVRIGITAPESIQFVRDDAKNTTPKDRRAIAYVDLPRVGDARETAAGGREGRADR
jgi:carbon storage regulator CsrA